MSAAEQSVTSTPWTAPPDSWTLRSDEESLYYSIWSKHFEGVRPDATLGAFATA